MEQGGSSLDKIFSVEKENRCHKNQFNECNQHHAAVSFEDGRQRKDVEHMPHANIKQWNQKGNRPNQPISFRMSGNNRCSTSWSSSHSGFGKRCSPVTSFFDRSKNGFRCGFCFFKFYRHIILEQVDLYRMHTGNGSNCLLHMGTACTACHSRDGITFFFHNG